MRRKGGHAGEVGVRGCRVGCTTAAFGDAMLPPVRCLISGPFGTAGAYRGLVTGSCPSDSESLLPTSHADGWRPTV